ncbi:hypothetical protein ASAC_1146 [Acidilobus saccharovorans 345-15]|uniref:Uncharacterized protein n=1 Tax=Acidilobus saccharovorans (strain DSM 16705 / JCM 18335 / VKM B-2471 / 345-15) TaxID=666510 RepID=D9Q2L3_ACIS3|nr:hypothetical protein [Acidilobus saccharovorans]ADL19551.1 hypothetical protein ASAC_1146 [Acidilobus saccharovorans 345-15]
MSSDVETNSQPAAAELYLEDIKGIADEVARLLFIAGSTRGSAAAQLSVYASLLYDELIAKVNLRDHVDGIINLTGEPLSSAADVVDCMGYRAVASLLVAASKALEGESLEAYRRDLELFADCMGWLVSPQKMLSDEQRGAAVLVSFAAAINKWLEELASS